MIHFHQGVKRVKSSLLGEIQNFIPLLHYLYIYIYIYTDRLQKLWKQFWFRQPLKFWQAIYPVAANGTRWVNPSVPNEKGQPKCGWRYLGKKKQNIIIASLQAKQDWDDLDLDKYFSTQGHIYSYTSKRSSSSSFWPASVYSKHVRSSFFKLSSVDLHF